jgi:hypothetical protein
MTDDQKLNKSVPSHCALLDTAMSANDPKQTYGVLAPGDYALDISSYLTR